VSNISNITTTEFIASVIIIIAAFTLVGFVIKKNTPLGLLLGAGLCFVLYNSSGLRIADLIDIFR
jgi:hypothetical protein